jgi:large conductance mechanosensitive channel
MLNTMRGFKDFVLRGNVIDLSVGIVIGAAFTALVKSFTDAFILPALQLFHSGENPIGGGITVHHTFFPLSTFGNGVITFLITAGVLYFLVVMPMNKLAERRKKGIEPEPAAPSEEVLLLREIRDALKAGRPVPTARKAAPGK